MIHGEYNQIEILNGVKDRGRILTLQDVPRFYGKTDVFTSVARYKDAIEYIRDNGKIKGYDSIKWYDYIVIDFDEFAPLKVKTFIQHLEVNYEIPIDQIRIYFSGNKGFHIYIPSTLFGLMPAKRLNNVVALIVKELATNILDYDTSLYDANQVIRLVNTIHPKSGLYKVPLDFHFLQEGEGIRTWAKESRDIKSPYPTAPIPGLVTIAKTLSNSLRTMNQPKNQAVDLKFKKLCYLSMMKGIKKGVRNEIAFRLACNWRKDGYDIQYTLSLMHQWNSRNVPPLSDDEINNSVVSAFGHDYDFGCNDEYLTEHCNSECYLYRRRNA